MLTPHTAGPFPPSTPVASPSTPQSPQGALSTPRFQQHASPQNSAPATPPLHTSVHISFPSLARVESPAANPSEMSPDPPLTSTLASHPLQLAFLITFPDPSFPIHLPPPSSSHTPLPPTVSVLSPTFGILNPSPIFLLPSLTVPAESLASWWDLPDEASIAEGNRAPEWQFRLREVQETRERISRRDDVTFTLWRHGRGIGRRV